MASTTGKPPSHQRQPSRPNSASSSSVVTVQRAASLSSRQGARHSTSGLRSPSPNETRQALAPISSSAMSLDPRRRSSAVHSRPNSVSGFSDGMGNLNRWSQSTASSKSSAQNNRRNSFARRLSGSLGSLSAFANSQQSPPPHRNVLTKSRQSSAGSPQSSRLSPSQQPPKLPPVLDLPLLSQAVDAAESPSTPVPAVPTTAELLPSSTYNGRPPDYFGAQWQGGQLPNKKTNVQWAPAETSPTAIDRTGQFTTSGSRQQEAKVPSAGVSPQKDRARSRFSHNARGQPTRAGHSRNHSEARKGSAGTEGESSASSARSSRDKERRRKVPSQKTMLSKALQKANHAVLLDNAQNFEGAMNAYGDACTLLKQVMVRSSGEEDRKKLEAIRNTYTNRINELQNLDTSFPSSDDKALPERPVSNESQGQEPFSPVADDDEDMAIVGTATVARIGGNPQQAERKERRPLTRDELPPRRQSLMPYTFADQTSSGLSPSLTPQPGLQETLTNSVNRGPKYQTSSLAPPIAMEYLPPPLSPRRLPFSTAPERPPSLAYSSQGMSQPQSREPNRSQHLRQDTMESTSWLDTIDESDGSSSSCSSVHSRTLSIGVRRKRIRAPSGATEAEFDAALDAAVEAAYDDGFELADDYEEDLATQTYARSIEDDFVSNARRNVELAKQRVREAEREAALLAAKDHERKRVQAEMDGMAKGGSVDLDYSDDEAEEEERILEEMTRDYIMDEVEFDMQSKSALPRQSDSSGFSGRTWGSSIGSNPATAGTSLSTVAEGNVLPSLALQLQAKPPLPPSLPPPAAALPPPPIVAVGPAVSASNVPATPSPTPPPKIKPPRLPSIGVRDRRLSGQNVKQLKIEVNSKLPADGGPKTQPVPEPSPLVPAEAVAEAPKSASLVRDSQQLLPSTIFNLPEPITAQVVQQKAASPAPPPTVNETGGSPDTPALTKSASVDSEDSVPVAPSSPMRLVNKTSTSSGNLRKKLSSSSLKNRSLSVSTPTASDDSPSTPMSTVFTAALQTRKDPLPAVPAMPTPIVANFVSAGPPTAGINFIENGIYSPNGFTQPDPLAGTTPLPLEPCPESYFLRPFWLLRCIYNITAHPRGGYLSGRLFVPRDIWRVKNVKIKGIEDKVAALDLLTAALLKLGKADTLDADALLEEMQSFESVLDQVKTTLTKKIGNEVGVQGSAALFKGSAGADEPSSTSEALGSKSANVSSKLYLHSWRKLRPKNSSGVGLLPAMTTTTNKNGIRETLTMKSLPMTSIMNPRFPKRDPSQVECVGPYANYMSALARLCDAAQVLDEIVRQVEDPGLKHTSQTHVGLEFSTQHAAEFFGFYVCRFVLNDIGMMLDKFIKRGTEWVST